MQNHNDGTIITSDTVLRKIYLSLYLKGLCVRERERERERVGDRTEMQHIDLPPTVLAITAFLSRSPRLLNRGPGGPLFWVLVFSTASCFQLVWSPN